MPDPELNGRNKYLRNKVKQFGLIAGFFACGCAASLCLDFKTLSILNGGLSASFCLAVISAACKLRYENDTKSSVRHLCRYL